MSLQSEDFVRQPVTRIKICGITNREDAEAAVEFGADALGFIFVPDTPRYVGDRAAELTRDLPPFIARVAVCADAEQARAVPTEFDTLQLYSGETDRPGARFIRAFRIRDASSLDEIALMLASAHSRPQALQLDAYHPGKLGGSGVAFNWDLAIEAKGRFGPPIVLAGGLTPENVAEAVRAVRPYAVDVSSGVEAEPGRKDHTKLRNFIEAIRAEDASK